MARRFIEFSEILADAWLMESNENAKVVAKILRKQHAEEIFDWTFDNNPDDEAVTLTACCSCVLTAVVLIGAVMAVQVSITDKLLGHAFWGRGTDEIAQLRTLLLWGGKIQNVTVTSCQRYGVSNHTRLFVQHTDNKENTKSMG